MSRLAAIRHRPLAGARVRHRHGLAQRVHRPASAAHALITSIVDNGPAVVPSAPFRRAKTWARRKTRRDPVPPGLKTSVAFIVVVQWRCRSRRVCGNVREADAVFRHNRQRPKRLSRWPMRVFALASRRLDRPLRRTKSATPPVLAHLCNSNVIVFRAERINLWVSRPPRTVALPPQVKPNEARRETLLLRAGYGSNRRWNAARRRAGLDTSRPGRGVGGTRRRAGIIKGRARCSAVVGARGRRNGDRGSRIRAARSRMPPRRSPASIRSTKTSSAYAHSQSRKSLKPPFAAGANQEVDGRVDIGVHGVRQAALELVLASTPGPA